MWKKLPVAQREKYKTLITNFASLSEAFSQKADEGTTVAPIVNSKFQETVFQKSFNAISEDIANTSYDVSLHLKNGNKYLIGIKAFGIGSGDQKIAQFKSASASWGSIIQQIQDNAKNKTKEQADSDNELLYKELAIKIATLRNQRIASSKAQVKGFQGTDDNVEAIYHVLMTSKKDSPPQIFVGETHYAEIDIDKIQIDGSTTKNKPTNFKFTDSHHTYKYTSADSQLLMTFKNKDIVVETWDITYIEDPFTIFENLHNLVTTEIKPTILEKKSEVIDSVSWMITNKEGKLESSSGFNAFDGSTKLGKEIRQKRIDNIIKVFSNDIESNKLSQIIDHLNIILLGIWTQKKEDIKQRKVQRDKLMALVKETENSKLEEEISKLVYRSENEVYIPIPESRNFHINRPDFFGKDAGKFKAETGKHKNKLLQPKEKRTFKLEFLASGNIIDAYINQDDGKAIQSIRNQDILGKWLLHDVFQLKKRELLTAERLNQIGINAIRLSKFHDKKRGIGLEFIWIDVDNPPKDAVGWVKRK